jgi:hypothetical protein
MFSIADITNLIKEMSAGIKVQASLVVAIGVALILLWMGKTALVVILSLVGLLASGMLVSSLYEKYQSWQKEKQDRQRRTLRQKAGELGAHEYTEKRSEPFPDPHIQGLGWIVAIDRRLPRAFLTEPACMACRSTLVMRTNSTMDGVYLECAKCNVRHDVDDVGEARAVADTVLQGDWRSNPEKYRGIW